MALIPWRTATVTGIENETPDTRRFKLQMDDHDSFEFAPGQFITLDLPIHEKPNKRWRSYSIASNPDGGNEIELLIVLNPDGLGTNYLFNEVKVGSKLTYRGPQGVFILPKDLDKELFLICTGTGIAPFRSMAQHIYRNQIPNKGINLIYGCRKKENLLYYEEFTNLSKNRKGFSYLPTLSREDWEGHTGYVHAIYESLCADKKAAQFYLCGWKEMIDEAKQRILSMGYDKKDIILEIYG